MNVHFQILNKLKALAQNLFQNRDGIVYLYGSQARGDYRPSSDWDILIISNDSESSDLFYEKYIFPFAEIGWDFGEQITPLHFTPSEFNSIENKLFHDKVMKDAIKLTL